MSKTRTDLLRTKTLVDRGGSTLCCLIASLTLGIDSARAQEPAVNLIHGSDFADVSPDAVRRPVSSSVTNGNFLGSAARLSKSKVLSVGEVEVSDTFGTAKRKMREPTTVDTLAALPAPSDRNIPSAKKGFVRYIDTFATNSDYRYTTAEVQSAILQVTNTQQVSVANRIVPQIIQNQVGAQLRANFSSSSTAVVTNGGRFSTGLSAGDETNNSRNVWLNFTPSKYNRDAMLPGSDDLQEIEAQSINVLIGADITVGKRGIVGVFGGYEDTQLDVNVISAQQDTDGLLLGGYAGLAIRDWLFASVNGYAASLSTRLEEQAFGIQVPEVANYDSSRYGLGVDLNAVKNADVWSLVGHMAYSYTNDSYDSYVTDSVEVSLDDQSIGRFSVGAEVSYIGELFMPYVSLKYESDKSVELNGYDDNGGVVSAGLRADKERFYFDAHLSTLQGRDKEDLTMVGLNFSYSL